MQERPGQLHPGGELTVGSKGLVDQVDVGSFRERDGFADRLLLPGRIDPDEVAGNDGLHQCLGDLPEGAFDQLQFVGVGGPLDSQQFDPIDRTLPGDVLQGR